MRFYFKFIESLFDKKIDGKGLAIFRIVYSIILFIEVIQLYYFRNLVYDKIPFIEPSEINFAFPLIFWMISILFLIVGLKTKLAAILNYVLSLFLIGTISTYEYHMFYAYMGINFLLIFSPISQCLSLDRLLNTIKYSNSKNLYKPDNKVPQLYYFLFLFFGVAVVYFDSIFFKFNSYNWTNGLGVWLPASLPFASHFDSGFLLNQKYLVIFLGYLTVFFESIFPFTFFRKNFRLILLFIGVGLHLGILIEFPIPWFALGVTSLYILLVPVCFWEKIFTKKARQSKIDFFYDSECPLCIRTKIIIQYFDWFDAVKFIPVDVAHGNYPEFQNIQKDEMLNNIYSKDLKTGKLYSGVDTYIRVLKYLHVFSPLSFILKIPGVYQLSNKIYEFVAVNRSTNRCTDENCSFNYPADTRDLNEIHLFKNLSLKDLKVLGLSIVLFFLLALQCLITSGSAAINFGGNDLISNAIKKVSFGANKISKPFFGITYHGVFMDAHFKDYNHIIAVAHVDQDGIEKFLPIIDESGSPGIYCYGFNWVKWTFRVNNPHVNMKLLKTGIRDFTSFWAHKNGVDLNNARFNIKLKKIEIPQKWSKDFEKINSQNNWENIGKLDWKQYKASFEISEVENL